MSIASISYGSLRDASGEAKAVAKKLDRYADAIQDGVYKKLNSYNGPWSGNLSTAKSKANAKMSALRSEANKFERYSADLIDLKEQCEATDKSVKSKVSSLTATFKENHGINNSKVVNTISYFFTSVGNSTSLGRWLGDAKDQFDAGRDFLKGAISEWYNFDGGEDLLKGSLVAVLEIVIGVVAVVGAIITGGALLLVIASVIAGVIAIANGVTNLINEGRAYNATQNDDPATGRRRSSLDTLTDTIRAESDSRLAHNIATGIDVVNTVCTVITVGVSIAKNVGDLLKNGYKWATGNPANINSLRIRDILTKENFSVFTGKLKTSFVQGWTEISTALKYRDWPFFSQSIKNFSTDFANNFKGKYLDFSNFDKKFESTNNIIKTSFDFINDGLNLKSFGKIGLEVIPIAALPGGGFISVGDFTGILSDISDISDISRFEISKDGPINTEVLSKLSNIGNVNISIPNLHIPEIDINVPNIKVV